MAFDKSKYDQAYRKAHIVRKEIPFNREIPDDMDLLTWLDAQPENATQLIKRLIRSEMNRTGQNEN